MWVWICRGFTDEHWVSGLPLAWPLNCYFSQPHFLGQRFFPIYIYVDFHNPKCYIHDPWLLLSSQSRWENPCLLFTILIGPLIVYSRGPATNNSDSVKPTPQESELSRNPPGDADMASGLPGPPEFPWYPLFSRLELEGEIPCRTLILSLQPIAECDSLNYSTKWMYPCYLMPLSTKSIFLNQHPLLWNTPTWAGFWGFITKSSHTCLPMLVFLFTFLSLLLCYPPPSSTYPIPSLFNANIWDLLLCCFFKLPSQSSLASVMLPLHIFAEVSLNAKTYFPILWIEGSTFLPQT